MADDITPLASLSLTHVYYNPDDSISYICAWLALVPQALCVVYATLIWSTREAEVALMFAGQLACEGVNFALKRLIKEERPRRIHRTGGKGYGMPSSHAQFAFFWAVAVALFLVARHRPRLGQRHNRSLAVAAAATTTTSVQGGGVKENGCASLLPGQQQQQQQSSAASRLAALNADIERYAHEPWSFVQRALVSAVALALAGLVAWSRIYLGYHTEKQVLVGCAAGSLSAVGWFLITSLARQMGLLSWALELPVARWFRLRDLVVEQDLCQAGWESWERRRQRRLAQEQQQQQQQAKKKTT
ncbi:PAP2 superfamily-domain-containing protein [Lasiosphaeria miniovina]|uniref:Dolichyldiphosphatase n=1 Tax=Lasiosphaeria miniovina TaxID=1954250 RepID=A0AA40B6C9_9PEZI|nr:PAP2 superfamily-domain-containing protein [Lasiosphaeria miniovina]KAK0728123.1 PAP2 superfamily-domain-containing protein [Lasiosphaeria miniovina]